MRQAPLASGVLHDAGAGLALVLAPSIAAARHHLVLAAAEDLRQVLEQVSSEAHVDPGVTAAVKAGQQHGDDKSHVWGQRHRPVCSFTDANKLHMLDFTMNIESGVYFHSLSHLIHII